MTEANSDAESIDVFLEETSTSWNSDALLKTLNYAFVGGLTETSERGTQPSSIKIPLKPHQLALIHEMKQREEASLDGLRNGHVTTYTNFGVLGDSVGSGKSLVVLSHIAQLKSKPQTSYMRRVLHPLSTPNFFTVFDKKFSDTSGNNLIVVPHTLYRQWESYIKSQTTLSVFFVKSKHSLPINPTELSDSIGKADATLVSNTLYPEFIQYCTTNRIHWRRIFWDEADSIYIPSTSIRPSSCFHWFISATWQNFILEGHVLRPHLLTTLNANPSRYHPEFIEWMKQELGVSGEVGSTTPSLIHRIVWLRSRSSAFLKSFRSSHSLRGITVLRTSDAFMKVSRTMPPIIDLKFLCKQPAIQRAMQGYVTEDVKAMLHAGDIDGALEKLGVPANSPVSLLDAVNSQRHKELAELKNQLQYKENKSYATPQDKEKSIQKTKDKIASIEQQIQSFKDRIEQIKTEVCPICYDEPKSITITPCCSHIFCGSCILSSLSINSTCPLCRTPMTPTQLTRITDESEPKKKKKKVKEATDVNELLPKPKQLLKFLKENPNAKVLVFSRYEKPFHGLATECEEAGIQYTILKGNKDCIASTVRQFESGEKRVLFLPTQTAGAGMNLVAASHVVLLHVMTPEEERQVIGRAYRLGRIDPLTVVRLVHDGEGL